MTGRACRPAFAIVKPGSGETRRGWRSPLPSGREASRADRPAPPASTLWGCVGVVKTR